MQALSSQITDYLETGQHEKQLSPHTIKAYRIDLQQFSDFTKGVWADKDMLDCYKSSFRSTLCQTQIGKRPCVLP